MYKRQLLFRLVPFASDDVIVIALAHIFHVALNLLLVRQPRARRPEIAPNALAAPSRLDDEYLLVEVVAHGVAKLELGSNFAGRTVANGQLAAAAIACGGETVEKIVVQTVVVEKAVEVVKEVPVEKIVEREKTVVKIVEVVVTATPTATPTLTPTPPATPAPPPIPVLEAFKSSIHKGLTTFTGSSSGSLGSNSITSSIDFMLSLDVQSVDEEISVNKVQLFDHNQRIYQTLKQETIISIFGSEALMLSLIHI